MRIFTPPDDGLEVSVSDYGVGTAEREGKDGSLGRDLVRALAAKIEATVESRAIPGEGSTVTLRLRRRTTSGPEMASTPTAARQPA